VTRLGPDASAAVKAGRLPAGRSLAFRLAVALGLGAATLLGLALVLNLRLQRAQLEHLAGASGERIVETIRGATRDGMLRNDVDNVHRIIQNIGAQPGIDRIRIFNKEGRIRTSTRPEEVGALVDLRAEQCIACHQGGRPLDRLDRKDRIRTFRAPTGHRVLGVIAPIHNEAQCARECHAHPPAQQVLGVLDVQLSMEAVDQSLRTSERQLSWGLGATVAAVLALAGLLLWGMVLRPVHQLSTAMARAGQGDLSARVRVLSRDEIGELGHAWNGMSEELGRARDALQEWNRELEARVAEKTEALEQAHRRMLVVEKMASLGKLAAVLAHEINNPLAGIRTYARVLRRGLRGAVSAPGAEAPPAGGSSPPLPAPGPALPPPGETERILALVESEAARCGDIVRNMLLFSRESPARFAEVDLRPVIGRCLLLLRHQAELLGVRLEGDVAADLPRIVCDAGQVEQLLLALTMNGLEATRGGGSVGLRAQPAEGGGVTLQVSDTGCGIPPEHQTRIYEPFFTTKEQGKGVGLGLAVVYGIVTRHGGRIELRSRPGDTVFTVQLPACPPAADPGKEAAS
jgi:two-component system NtrC family sensor kinase